MPYILTTLDLTQYNSIWATSKCSIYNKHSSHNYDCVIYSKNQYDLIKSKEEMGCDLIGSWTVSVGDMDQALHLWKYSGGFEKIDHAKKIFTENPVRTSNVV